MDLNSLILKSEVKIFQHCNHERFICFSLPEKCPVCEIRLDMKSFRVPPFVLSSPFMKSLNKLPPISLILQSSTGDYAKLACDDLHIGITNSLSETFDFDYNGLKRNSKRWFDYPLIHIKLDQFRGARHLVSNETKKWDDLLDLLWKQKDQHWSFSQYNETNLNCFDFVINFLYMFGYFDLNEDESDDDDLSDLFVENNNLTRKFLKQKLTNELIEPVVRKSLKYIYLLIKLNNNEKTLLKEIVY